MTYKIVVRDNEGSIINEYHDSAENKYAMYYKAAQEWRIDECERWIDIQEEDA